MVNVVSTCPHKVGQCAEGDGAIQSTTLLGQEIGAKCLCKLLGIGSNRLRRGINGNPDLRYGKSKTGSTKTSLSVDAFLATLHRGVAETLPDRHVFKKLCFEKNTRPQSVGKSDWLNFNQS